MPRGAIARHAFHSAVADDDRDFFVYTPPGYDARRPQPYPVLYLLHGLGDDAERWMNGGAANHILDNLIAQRKAVPMIVVTPLGYGTSTGPAGGRTPENITGYTKILLEEVMPIGGQGIQRQQEPRAARDRWTVHGRRRIVVCRPEQPRQVCLDRRVQLSPDVVGSCARQTRAVAEGAAPARRGAADDG